MLYLVNLVLSISCLSPEDRSS